MNDRRDGFEDGPFVPDALFCLDSAPEAGRQLGAGFEVDRRANRQVKGKPAKHSLRVLLRHDRNEVFAVEISVKIAAESVHRCFHRRLGQAKSQRLEPLVTRGRGRGGEGGGGGTF